MQNAKQTTGQEPELISQEQSSEKSETIQTRTFLFKSLAALSDYDDLVTLVLSTAFITMIFPVQAFGEGGSVLRSSALIAVLLGFIFRLDRLQGKSAEQSSFMAGLADETARFLIVCFGVLLCLSITSGLGGVPWVIWPTWVMSACLIKIGLYTIGRRYHSELRNHSMLRNNVVIICASEQGVKLAGRIMEENKTAKILGFFDDRKDRVDASALPLPFLGTIKGILDYEREHHVDQVVIALPGMAKERLEDILNTISILPVSILMSPDIAILNRPQSILNARGPLNLLQLDARPVVGWRALIKRLEDITGACFAILIFSPAFILLPILIKLESPGPIFYRQKRYGFNNKLFDCYKFRSMRQDACVASQKEIKLTERDDPRVTKIGNFIRKTSLDEIPQFLNVLKGDMSLVGPRPHPPGVKAGGRIYEDVIGDFARRYKVKPGLTGWAQVNGARGNTFTEEDLRQRFSYDLDYIQNWSLWLDLVIIIRTAFLGFTGKNAF